MVERDYTATDTPGRTPVERWPVAPGATGLRTLRRVVRRRCDRLGLPDDLADSVVLAVDELATNALRCGAAEARMYEDPPAFGVVDTEPGGAETVNDHLGRDAAMAIGECGRGLAIVSALFPDHAVLHDGAGKEIYFEVTAERQASSTAPAAREMTERDFRPVLDASYHGTMALPASS